MWPTYIRPNYHRIMNKTYFITACLLTLCMCLNGLGTQAQNEFQITEGDTTYTMVKYSFCILKSGPNRNHNDSLVKEIQKGHMDHINKLAEENKISLAGPFENGGEWRGILVFNTPDLEEAKRWASTDPAIKAGRLVCECTNWWAARGSKLK